MWFGVAKKMVMVTNEEEKDMAGEGYSLRVKCQVRITDMLQHTAQ
jgi:hypothetical protein